MADIFQQILCVKHADNAVGVILIDGDSRITVFNRKLGNLLKGAGNLDCGHLGSVGHDIACVKVVKFKDVINHLFLSVFDNSLFAADINHHAYFFFGHIFFVCVGVKAEKANHRIC